MDKYEKEMLELIDSGKYLSEDTLRDIVSNFSISTEHGENRRWTREVTSILEIGYRYFEVEWEQGLIENQENEYDNQPIEVIPVEKTKTITYTEYVPLSKKGVTNG